MQVSQEEICQTTEEEIETPSLKNKVPIASLPLSYFHAAVFQKRRTGRGLISRRSPAGKKSRMLIFIRSSSVPIHRRSL